MATGPGLRRLLLAVVVLCAVLVAPAAHLPSDPPIGGPGAEEHFCAEDLQRLAHFRSP